jgi:branched-chain amino acid aminotransferase
MPPLAYFKKQFLPISECRISIMTHALHYGTACFEGIRGNWSEEEQEVFLFRAREHYVRFHKSCHIMRLKLPLSPEGLCELTQELVEKSGLKENVYIRPFAYKSSETIGPKLHGLEDDFFLTVNPAPPYLDVEKGIKASTSSWRRIDDSMVPPRAKVTGIYINCSLAKTEAVENGYDEAIMLNMDGRVSEGTGNNILLIMGNRVVTPSTTDNVLMGVTRDTVLRLAKDELGMQTEERPVDRSELYVADEAFLTGTLSHLVPVLEVDHRPVGTGKIGPITSQLSALYFDVIRGKVPKCREWCLPCYRKLART